MAKEKIIAVKDGKTEETMLSLPLEVKLESVKQAESSYTREELSANSVPLFGVKAECVTAALKEAGVETCTVSKAKEIVRKFMGKEIL